MSFRKSRFFLGPKKRAGIEGLKLRSAESGCSRIRRLENWWESLQIKNRFLIYRTEPRRGGSARESAIAPNESMLPPPEELAVIVRVGPDPIPDHISIFGSTADCFVLLGHTD